MSVVKSGLALVENRFEFVLHLLVQYLFTATSYEEALPPSPPSNHLFMGMEYMHEGNHGEPATISQSI